MGDQFPEEARKIHYNEAEMRSIYGKASKKDLNELKEEGIDTQMIPWVDNENH